MQVVALSGGKDSVAMLLRMVELDEQIDRIYYIDSEWEFEEVRETVKDVARLINREIETIWVDFNYWMFDRVRKKGKRKGLIGYGWPTARFRWCSGLKRWELDKAVRGKEEVVKCLGMAYDEQFRLGAGQTKRIVNRYPLVEWGWTQTDNMEYCTERGIDFGRFYKHHTRTGCYCCPLQSDANLKVLYDMYPGRWKKMEEMDSRSLNPFKHNHSVSFYAARFAAMNKQKKLEV